MVENLENTKGVIRSRKSQNDIQCNDQRTNNYLQNNTQKSNDRATQTSLKTGDPINGFNSVIFCVPVPSRDLELQRHISWSFILRGEVVVGFVDIVDNNLLYFLFVIMTSNSLLCFVCLRPVSGMSNVASVSSLTILDSVFSIVYFTISHAAYSNNQSYHD